jgi:hypothetical protein
VSTPGTATTVRTVHLVPGRVASVVPESLTELSRPGSEASAGDVVASASVGSKPPEPNDVHARTVHETPNDSARAPATYPSPTFIAVRSFCPRVQDAHRERPSALTASPASYPKLRQLYVLRTLRGDEMPVASRLTGRLRNEPARAPNRLMTEDFRRVASPSRGRSRRGFAPRPVLRAQRCAKNVNVGHPRGNGPLVRSLRASRLRIR